MPNMKAMCSIFFQHVIIIMFFSFSHGCKPKGDMKNSCPLHGLLMLGDGGLCEPNQE
jgi:hypothetical protein